MKGKRGRGSVRQVLTGKRDCVKNHPPSSVEDGLKNKGERKKKNKQATKLIPTCWAPSSVRPNRGRKEGKSHLRWGRGKG